jgi:hypothetical protein
MSLGSTASSRLCEAATGIGMDMVLEAGDLVGLPGCVRGNCRRGLALIPSRRLRYNLDDVHHSQVFMVEDVAVEDEASNVLSTEVNQKRDAGVRMCGVTVPCRHFDHIQILAGSAGACGVAVDAKLFCDWTRK